MKFGQFWVALMGLALSATAVNSASARIIVKERVTHYNVSGKTGERLWKSINRRGPKVRRTHAVATTNRKLKLRRVKTGIRGSKCVIKNVDMHVSLTYRYPKWVHRRSAKASARRTWDKFYKQLIRHEKAHGKIEKDFVKNVHRAFLKARGSKSKNCRDLKRKISRKIERLQKRANRAHRRLDRRDSYASARIRRYQRRTLNIN